MIPVFLVLALVLVLVLVFVLGGSAVEFASENSLFVVFVMVGPDDTLMFVLGTGVVLLVLLVGDEKVTHD